MTYCVEAAGAVVVDLVAGAVVAVVAVVVVVVAVDVRWRIG